MFYKYFTVAICLINAALCLFANEKIPNYVAFIGWFGFGISTLIYQRKGKYVL